MKDVSVKIKDQSYTIEEVSIGGLLEVLKTFKDIQEKYKDIKLSDLQSGDDKVIVPIVMRILAESGDEAFVMLSEISTIDEKVIRKMSIAETVRLIKALLEVNDFEVIKKEWGELAETFNSMKLMEKEVKGEE
jgi:hypothetical protein